MTPIRIDISETTLDGETIHYIKSIIILGFTVFAREYNQVIAGAPRKTSGFDVLADMRQEVDDDEE